MRFRYHHPIPNFFKVENPINPLTTISEDLLNELEEFILNKGFVGVSYSKLSDDFKGMWDIDWDNILILKYEMSEDILKMKPSKEKTVLEDKEFQDFGHRTFDIVDFLSSKNVKKCYSYVNGLDMMDDSNCKGVIKKAIKDFDKIICEI